MPPALRNHRAPTVGDTPAPTAASSLERPAAINTQNRCRSSRRATEGRPSDGNAPRPDRSERRFRTVIATSSLKVLRRPVEPGLALAILVVVVLAGLSAPLMPDVPLAGGVVLLLGCLSVLLANVLRASRS